MDVFLHADFAPQIKTITIHLQNGTTSASVFLLTENVKNPEGKQLFSLFCGLGLDEFDKV